MSVVALVREPSPDRKVRELTERLLSHFRKPAWSPDRPVLLKVNCLCRSKPDEGYDVHPEVVLAVARRFRDWGYEVIIGDNEGRKILESTGVGNWPTAKASPCTIP